MLHSHVSEVLHRTATQFAMAESAEMFDTGMEKLGKFIQGPIFSQIDLHTLPEFPQAIMNVEGLRKPPGHSLDELSPMMKQLWVTHAVPFRTQSFNGSGEFHRACIDHNRR